MHLFGIKLVDLNAGFCLECFITGMIQRPVIGHRFDSQSDKCAGGM